MDSWLYGLLLGLGISSLVLCIGVIIAGSTLANIAENKYEPHASKYRIASIVMFSILPLFIIAGIVLLSVTLSVGKI